MDANARNKYAEIAFDAHRDLVNKRLPPGQHVPEWNAHANSLWREAWRAAVERCGVDGAAVDRAEALQAERDALAAEVARLQALVPKDGG